MDGLTHIAIAIVTYPVVVWVCRFAFFAFAAYTIKSTTNGDTAKDDDKKT